MEPQSLMAPAVVKGVRTCFDPSNKFVLIKIGKKNEGLSVHFYINIYSRTCMI